LPRAARLTPAGTPAPRPIDRTELRRAYRPDEEQIAAERIEAQKTVESICGPQG